MGTDMNYLQAEVSVDGGAKIFLQNKLSRSRAKLLELNPLLEAKGRCASFESEQADNSPTHSFPGM
jgi:hypothetical protein